MARSARLDVTVDGSGAKRGVSEVDRELQKLKGLANVVESAFKALSGAVAAIGIGALISKIVQTNREFQNLKSQLVTATGSVEGAGAAFNRLQTFAAKTPFTLNQSVEAFVKLKNLGLDPSERALKSYGNTASSMGKDLMQMIEAVADASTGEFERLKEFGIKAKVNGDQVALTFRGVTTTVANSSSAIQDYLLKIGETQFAGAMDRQAQTLDGAISNLEDSFGAFARAVGDAGLNKGLADLVSLFTEAAQGSNDLATTIGAGLGAALSGFADAVRFTADALSTLAPLLGAAAVGIATYHAALAVGAITQYVASLFALEAALGATNIAMAASSIAAKGLQVAFAGMQLALGPIGIAIGAATAAYILFNQKQDETKQRAQFTEDALGKLKAAHVNNGATAAVAASNAVSAALEREAAAAYKTAKAANVLAANRAGADFKTAQARVAQIKSGQDETILFRATHNPGEISAFSKANLTVAEQNMREAANRAKVAVDAVKQLDSEFAKLGTNAPADLDPIIDPLRTIDDKTKSAKAATDELARSYESLLQRLDPAAAAAKEYAKALDDIAKLKAAGKIDGLQAAKLGDAAQAEYEKQKLEKLKPELSDAVQQGFTTPIIDTAMKASDLLGSAAKDMVDRIASIDEAVKSGTMTESAAREARRQAKDDYQAISDRFGDGMANAARAFRNEGLDAAQAIAQIIGGSIGGTFGKIIGVLEGLSSGNFNGVGGKLGGLLTLLSGNSRQNQTFGGGWNSDGTMSVIDKALGTDGTFQSGMAKVFDPLKKIFKDLGSKFDGLFGSQGSFSQMLGQASAGAAVGSAVGGIMKGLGIKTSQTGAQIGGAIGSFIPIPGGAIIGSIAGGLIGGALMKTKKGSSSIGYDDAGNFAITSTVGNSGSRKKASIDAANSVISSLQNIADSFGGNIGGEFGVSIGMRNKKYVVDTTGQNRTKGAGVLKFTDQAEALKAAVQDAIRDGAIEGLREGTRNLLNGSGDIEAQLQKAVKFENVFRELKQRADPVGAAIDDLNREFTGLKRIFTEAGASAADWASLEELYQAKRLDIIEQGNNAALKSMQDYLNDLKGGSNSPLSAQIKYANTLAALTQLDAKRASGKAVDFGDYQTAADNFLAASREFNGSNSTFFRDFERITSTVQGLINAEMNKVTTTAPTVDFTPVVNAVQEQTTVTTNLLDQIAKLLAGRNGAGTGTTTTAANDAASALANARYYLNF